MDSVLGQQCSRSICNNRCKTQCGICVNSNCVCCDCSLCGWWCWCASKIMMPLLGILGSACWLYWTLSRLVFFFFFIQCLVGFPFPPPTWCTMCQVFLNKMLFLLIKQKKKGWFSYLFTSFVQGLLFVPVMFMFVMQFLSLSRARWIWNLLLYGNMWKFFSSWLNYLAFQYVSSSKTKTKTKTTDRDWKKFKSD